MDGAAVAAGDHHLASRLGLDVIEQVDQDRVDELPFSPDGQRVLLESSAVEVVRRAGGVLMVDVGRVDARALTPEILLGDLRVLADVGHLPGVLLPHLMLGRGQGVMELVVAPMDELPLGVEPPELFLFRLLHS